MTPEQTSLFCTALAIKASQDPGLPVPNPTTSYWQQNPAHKLAHHQSTNLPTTADIVIIGSGITGISTAYHLLQQQPSLSLVILEARALTSGATGRNGGHCKEVPYVDYSELKALYGKEGAAKIVRFRLAQLDALLELNASLSSSPDSAAVARRVNGLDVYYDQQVFDRMKEKLTEYLADFPDEKDTWLVFEGDDINEKFGTVNAVGCMTGPAGALWPYKLVGAVTSQLYNKYPNLSIETHTPVESITPSTSSPSTSLVKTSRGEIHTKHIIHCTNAYAGHLLPGLRGKLFPIRGQMTRQAVPAGFPRVGDRYSWLLHYAPGYDYITQSPVAESGDVYIGGGLLKALLSGNVTVEDADIGNVRDDLQSEEALKAVETVLEERFRDGKGARVLDKWTGVMGFTVDEAPIVGRVPDEISGRKASSEWVAAGFCGHGMAYCWLTGKAVADMLLKGEDSVKEWFPTEQYACSSQRLDKTTLQESLLSFIETVA